MTQTSSSMGEMPLSAADAEILNLTACNVRAVGLITPDVQVRSQLVVSCGRMLLVWRGGPPGAGGVAAAPKKVGHRLRHLWSSHGGRGLRHALPVLTGDRLAVLVQRDVHRLALHILKCCSLFKWCWTC